MWKLSTLSAMLVFCLVPQMALSDGVNAGLADANVAPPERAVTAGEQPLQAIRINPVTGRQIIFGSNQVGRPGVAPDQIGGYDVNVAYDHVAVGVAIVAVLFLMTEWMDVR